MRGRAKTHELTRVCILAPRIPRSQRAHASLAIFILHRAECMNHEKRVWITHTPSHMAQKGDM